MSVTRHCDICTRVIKDKVESVEITVEKIKCILTTVDPDKDICANCVGRILGKGIGKDDLKIKEKK